jgi:hypothetical protein
MLQLTNKVVWLANLQTTEMAHNCHFTLCVLETAFNYPHHIDTKKAIDEGHPFDDSLQ